MNTHRPHLSFLSSWRSTALLCLLILGSAAAVILWPRSDDASLSRHYNHIPGIKATYFKDYPINDTLSINVTLLEALDSTAWSTLRNDFNIAELDPALQQLINSGLDPLFTRRVNKDDYTQSVDSTCPNSQLLAFSYTSQTVTLFHVTNKEEIHAVLYHNLDISTKQ
ncbi:MAG: hypothetical protein IK126_12255 [Bacteroidales bacterium]|nr:hypothetical protein [Bacteroidales bacterium]